MAVDLMIRAGRVFCPATGRDGPGMVAVRDGRLVAAADGDPASKVLEYPDALLLPGLVDLHAHPARGGSKYGICPDRYMLPTGVTTVLSQGDAGALTWPAYRDDVVRACRTRVRLALNLSARGEASPVACFGDPADVDVGACVAALAGGADDLWGISVNVSRFSSGATDPRWVVGCALEAAARSGKPLLYGPRETVDWPLADQLAQLRPGDVVTYCYMSTKNVLEDRRRVHPAAREARARGVLFDVGHGTAAYDHELARVAIAEGFPPDTVSSDLYAAHLGRTPRHDLPRVISQLIAAGMPERDAFAAATARAAAALGLAGEIGTLAPGSCADLAVLRKSGGVWQAIQTIRAGRPC
ncbi:MAG: amidohydrolase family protein [Alphaproteobacteria bacterium]|nr:amidohydrolase family protein [Alphaproteobacteria bacterium]